MREMKDSGVSWIGMIPNDWNLNKIGSVYEERNTKVSDTEYEPLSVTKQGIVPQLETAAKTDNGDNRKLIKKNDFVINSRSDRRGSCGISDREGSCSLINTVLKPRKDMINEYYSYVFKTESFADEYYHWGHGIVDDLWSTKWTDMKSIYIPFPSLDEQKRIADYLDSKCSQIDSTVTKLEAIIERLKKYRFSIITEAVTKGLNSNVDMKDTGIDQLGLIPSSWNVSEIRFVCDMQAGNSLSSEVIQENGTYPVYGGNGIRGYYDDYNVSDKVILVGRQGALCGNVHLINEHIWATEHAVITKAKNNIEIDYLYFALLAANLNQYVSSTAAQPGLAVSTIKKVKIAVPSKEEQITIADYITSRVSKIDEQVKLLDLEVLKLSEYKKSLIYEVVTGKKEV